MTKNYAFPYMLESNDGILIYYCNYMNLMGSRWYTLMNSPHIDTLGAPMAIEYLIVTCQI